MPIEIKTGVGRIVWGNPGKAQTKKDPQTKQVIMKDGQPVQQWAFGVAYPKAEFQRDIWPAMAREAATGYPNGTPQKFSWKYVDGDSIDGNGQPYSNREGYAGCYVLTISTEAFAPPVFKWNGRSYDQLNGDQIKTGDYVVLSLNMKVNVPTDRTHTPSLYVNPIAIEHVGYGQEIQNTGADPMALFGGAQYQLPPGASQTPLAPAHGVGMPGTGQQPQPGQMPGTMPPPAPDFVQNAGYQQQPGFPGGAAMPGMVPSSGPASMPGNGAPQLNNGPNAMPAAYPSNPQQQPQYAPQPGQMPGMMPQR